MLSVIKTILGSGDVVSKGMDLIDSMHTSDEEAIKAKTKAKTDLLSAYAPFKIAQRVLAIMFVSVFLSCFLLALGAVLLAWYQGTLVVTDGSVNPVLVQAIIALMGAFKIHWAVITIVGFYFGGGAFEGYQEKKQKRAEAEREAEKARDQGGRPGPPGGGP
jgi:hypothetical protein